MGGGERKPCGGIFLRGNFPRERAARSGAAESHSSGKMHTQCLEKNLFLQKINAPRAPRLLMMNNGSLVD